jgi:hypothetical protein
LQLIIQTPGKPFLRCYCIVWQFPAFLPSIDGGKLEIAHPATCWLAETTLKSVILSKNILCTQACTMNRSYSSYVTLFERLEADIQAAAVEVRAHPASIIIIIIIITR